MAATVSLINQPYTYNPVNAPMYIVAYSNDYVVQNFSYLYNLFSYDRVIATESNFLGQYKIPPRPTGEGVFDIHKILKASVFNDYDFPMSVITSSTFSVIPVLDDSALVKFQYNYGFEEYIGFTFSGTNDAGFGEINLEGVHYPTFNVGDVVFIQMSGSSQNQQYNGPVEILGFSGESGDAYVAIPVGVSETNIPGMITTYDRIIGSSSFGYAINGTRQYYNTHINSLSNQNGLTDIYGSGNFVIPSGGSGTTKYNFLTNYNTPDSTIYKEIFLNQYETVSLLSHTQSSYNLTVTTYDKNFQQINSVVSSNRSIPTDYVLYNLPIGTANLSSTINFATASYYTIEMNVGSDFSLIRRKIKKNCGPYMNVRLMFLNRLGGWDYYNFDYDSTISMDITRTTFEKTINWNYTVGDRGTSVLTTQAATSTIVNSDWITEYDYTYLQELFTSPNVFVIDEITLVKLPIVIQDTSWTQKTQLRDKLFNVSLTFKYAYNINLQTN